MDALDHTQTGRLHHWATLGSVNTKRYVQLQKEGKKCLFNDALKIFFMIMRCQIYGRGS